MTCRYVIYNKNKNYAFIHIRDATFQGIRGSAAFNYAQSLNILKRTEEAKPKP